MMHYMLEHKSELVKLLRMVEINVTEAELDDDHIHFGEKSEITGEKGEKPLVPSCDYLCKIIEELPNNKYAQAKIRAGNAESVTTIERRKLLDNPVARAEAILYIKEHYGSLLEDYKGIFFLEGSSKPDVFIETANQVIVIEGKWTERHPTESTTYVENRNQMVRHIHDALNYVRLGKFWKKVVGFYILADTFANEWNAQISPEGFASTLSSQFGIEAEHDEIASAYKGYITWEQIVESFPGVADSSRGWKKLAE